MIIRVKRTVLIGDGHLDINDWMEETISPSARIEHEGRGREPLVSRSTGFDRLYEKYVALCGNSPHRPRYAVDMIGITAGAGWKTVMVVEFEGEDTLHEDWLVKIEDPAYAVQFKLMMA
jgi:hypothetical protein